jgi:hypothetical protein
MHGAELIDFIKSFTTVTNIGLLFLACDLCLRVCYILVNRLLGLAVSPVDGSRQLPKDSVCFCFDDNGKSPY